SPSAQGVLSVMRGSASWGFSRDSSLFFFFQAEDGIRDKLVTGVQTCALPICTPRRRARRWPYAWPPIPNGAAWSSRSPIAAPARSEERRVGKECRSRGGPDQEKKNKQEITGGTTRNSTHYTYEGTRHDTHITQ